MKTHFIDDKIEKEMKTLSWMRNKFIEECKNMIILMEKQEQKIVNIENENSEGKTK